MKKMNLSEKALSVINDYLNLGIKDSINCPYFNNTRSKVRGGLRSLVGKGSPEEIVEEAKLFATKEKVDLNKMDQENLKKFLVDHNLGIDCSGFAFYTLSAEVKEKTGKDLAKSLKFPFVKNPLRKLFTKMRAVQNTDVRTLADNANSKKIELENIQPGDMIVMLEVEGVTVRDHVLIIHEILDKTIKYSHSIQWPVDGKYNHGVRQGEIKIINENKSLLEQDWSEKEALEHGKKAKRFEIRRLNVLN